MKILLVSKNGVREATKDDIDNILTDIVTKAISVLSSSVFFKTLTANQDLATSVMNIKGSNPTYFQDKLNEFIISSLEQTADNIEEKSDMGTFIKEELPKLAPEVETYALHLLKTYDRKKGGEYTKSLR